MIAVRDVETPGLVGRLPFFSAAEANGRSLLLRTEAGMRLPIFKTLYRVRAAPKVKMPNS